MIYSFPIALEVLADLAWALAEGVRIALNNATTATNVRVIFRFDFIVSSPSRFELKMAAAPRNARYSHFSEFYIKACMTTLPELTGIAWSETI
jgi:hypothetical protein